MVELSWHSNNFRDRAAGSETPWLPQTQLVHLCLMSLLISLHWHTEMPERKLKWSYFPQYLLCPKASKTFTSREPGTELNSEQTVCTLRSLRSPSSLVSPSTGVLSSFPNLPPAFSFFLQFLTSFLNLINIDFLSNISLSTTHKIPFIHVPRVAKVHLSLFFKREKKLSVWILPSFPATFLSPPITTTLSKERPILTASLSFPFNYSLGCPLMVWH